MAGDTNLNTTDTLTITRPEAPKAKDWDDMTEAEQAAARAKAASALADASKPNPTADRDMDRAIGNMKAVFGEQKRVKIMLHQITPAQKATGAVELPKMVVGINGYNFVLPRAVPLDVPVDLARVVYQAGEIHPHTMVQLGLMTIEEMQHDLNMAEADAQRLADLIKPREM